jgi:hypothetical protein
MNAGSYSNWMIGMIFLIPLIQAEEIEEWLDSAKFCTSCVITYTSYFFYGLELSSERIPSE